MISTKKVIVIIRKMPPTSLDRKTISLRGIFCEKFFILQIQQGLLC